MAKRRVAIFPLEFDLDADLVRIQTQIAKQTAQEIRDNSPRSKGGKGKHYATGWTFEQDGLQSVVFNDGKKASLTHLLELPHLTKNGSVVQPQPHIGPAFDKFSAEYDKRISEMDIKPKQ